MLEREDIKWEHELGYSKITNTKAMGIIIKMG